MTKKILAADDDPGILRLLVYTLQHEGYQVLTATNGLQALREARCEKPDLVITDLMLPGIDGYEICHRLRDDAVTARLPILILSAKSQEIDKTTALNVGADGYICKPWHRQELLTKIAEMLGGKIKRLSPRL